MRTVLALLLAVFLLAACDRSSPPPAPAPPSSSPTASPHSSTPASAPVSNAAPSGRLNTQVPTPRVARIPTTIPPESPATTTTPSLTDTDLTNAVRQAISGDPTLSPAARRIDVQTTDGVVRLSGTLATQLDKDNLRSAVARVPGIKSIDNRVLVRP